MTARTSAGLLAVVVVAGCGRTSLVVGRDAGAPADVPVTSEDAPTGADGRLPDPIACRSDEFCSDDTVCTLDRTEPLVDLAAAKLACDRVGGDPVGTECRLDSDCARGLCAVAGVCVVPCLDDASCPDGDECRPVYVRTSVSTIQTLDACVPELTPAPGVAVERSSVGEIAGRSDIELGPAGPTTQFTLLSGAPLEVFRLIASDPDDVVLFNVRRVGPGLEAPLNPVIPSGDVVTVLLPNGGYPVESATSFRLRAEPRRPTSLDIVRFERAAPGTVLNLDIYYVGGGDLTPAGPRGPARIASAVDALERYLMRGAMRIGVVRQHEIVGGLRLRYSVLTIGLDGELEGLAELFELTRGARWPSVAIFLIRDMDGALGISGGIPGPHVQGTGSSGVAIAVDLHDRPGITGRPDVDRTLSHEVGHHLGLFHTTELDGSVTEPLADTVVCSLDRDDGDGFLLPDECLDGGGGENLMFWAAAGADMTDGQLDVLRHALVLE